MTDHVTLCITFDILAVRVLTTALCYVLTYTHVSIVTSDHRVSFKWHFVEIALLLQGLLPCAPTLRHLFEWRDLKVVVEEYRHDDDDILQDLNRNVTLLLRVQEYLSPSL